jgi:hypothetical protein
MRQALVSWIALVGCGGSSSAPIDGAVDGPGPPSFPAPHPSEPQLLKGEGPILASPTIVPITFAADGYRADIEAFTSGLGASGYWQASAAPYGISAIRAAAPIHLGMAAPAHMTTTEIATFVTAQFTGTSPAWGAPDASKIYGLFYPKSTQVEIPGVGIVCVDIAGGYHAFVEVAGVKVAYSVIVECDAGLDGTRGVDALTLAISHELIEAATNPFGAGYYVDSDHYAMLAFAGSGEIADLCEFTDVWFKPADLGYAVTRTWLNDAASAGHMPCIPALPGAYFNTAPVLADPVHFRVLGIDLATKGVAIPVGGRATVELDLFSDAPTTEPWQIRAVDIDALTGKPPVLQFSFDRNTGGNGDKLHVTIDVLSGDPVYDAEPFVIISQLGTTLHTWFAIVGNS